MSGWIKSLWQDSLVYGVGYGISRFLQIIILPIIAQALTLSEFGYYSNYVIFYTFAAGFFVLGLDSAVARFFYDSSDKRYHQKLLSSAFLFISVISLVSVILISFFSDGIMFVLKIPPEYSTAMPYVLACIPAVAMNNLFLSWFKWNRQKTNFLLNSGGSVLLLLLPLLIADSVDFTFIFQVLLFSQVIVAVVSAVLAGGYLRPLFDTKLIRALLVYGFPWLLVFLFGVSRTYLDRIFLTQYLKDDVYGIYNFSVRISTLISLVITAFDMSFGPLAFRIWNQEGAQKFFARLQSVYIFFISLTGCLICIGSPLIIKLLGGAKYEGSEKILPFLVFAAIPISLINFSNLGTAYAKKSFLSTLSLFIGFAAVLVFNLLFTRIYLQYGAAGSSLAGHLLIVAAGYYFSRKYYRIPFSFAKDAGLFLVFFVLSVVAVNFSLHADMYWNIAIQVLGACLLALLLFLFILPVELKRALEMLRGIKIGRSGDNTGIDVPRS